MLQIGDQLDRYQILAYLARGGMADIFRAYDLVDHREVVIKIPEPSMIGDPAQFERFQREVEVVRSLNHPAILHGLEAGQYNRTPYLVTELVEGRSLRSIIETSAPLAVEEALLLVTKIAEGMAYCHANGVIHRDLKPENILVTEAGQPVIMDFGLALTKSAHRVTYSNLSATMGTPDYMAPEQVEGQRGDARTDVYALGVILFELLSGRPPFVGDSPLAVMAMHLQQDAPRLDCFRPDAPAALTAITARCLSRNPEARYADMPALIEALNHSETVDVSTLAQPAAETPASGGWSSTVIRAVAIGIAILAVLAVLAFLLQRIKG